MLGWLRVTLCALSLYPALPSSAATVFRCEDDSGHVLFTEQGCSHTATQTLQKADNPPPGGRLAQKGRGKSPPRRKHANASAGMHIVGIQEARTCGTGLSETERRRAQVRNEVRAGMSRKEVESSLGKPTRVSGQDGRMRYLYQDKRSGRQQVVSFGEDGCVKGKRR